MKPPFTTEPTVVCITPVKNEEWILRRFLDAASLWADQIIVLDQCSEDSSREIAMSHPKVRLLLDDEPAYDEGRRQRTLLAAARAVPGPKVIVALDADEALSGDLLTSAAWRAALASAPGTVIRLRWANLLPGCTRAWMAPDLMPFGFVDDGREHVGGPIHNRRVPDGPDQPSIVIDEGRVMHYQLAAWDRMLSKQRWYQCWERLRMSEKRPIQLYRQYHFMDAIPPAEVHPVPSGWMEPYVAAGLDMTSIPEQAWYRWDIEVLDWLVEHGPSTFARLDVWDPDYGSLAERVGRSIHDVDLGDPRGPVTRLVHRWLARTQPYAGRNSVRLVQRALVPFGW